LLMSPYRGLGDLSFDALAEQVAVSCGALNA